MNVKKKIAHVHISPKLSGVQQISFDILKNLDEEQFDKYLICGNGVEEKSFTESFEKIGVKVIIIGDLKRSIGLHDIFAFIKLYKLFKEKSFDIVHTNSTKPGIVARIAARVAGVKKIVHTVHGIAFHNSMNFFARIFFWLVENISTLFGDENVSVNKKYTHFYPLVKTKVIYNGIDFSGFSVKYHERKNIHFAFMARLDEQKNPLEFIEAVNLIHKNHLLIKIPLRFTLAGDGKMAQQCKSLIRKYNLEKVISMPGWIEDKSAFLSDIDVLCQPSKWEAFGLIFVEAAFFNVPAIARDVEGIPEVIKDGETGLLYRDGAEALKERMLLFINNPEMINTMGQNAALHVKKSFNIEKMLDAYNKLYVI